jgi:bifunctional enzyme CysN/CysC
LPARFPIQDIYDDSGRQVAVGRLESGTLREGERLVFWPSGREVKAEFVHAPDSRTQAEYSAGRSIAMLLPPGSSLKRGEVGAPSGAVPRLGRQLRLSLFWLGRRPLQKGRSYLLRLATVEVEARVREIFRLVRTDSLTSTTSDLTEVGHSEVADLMLEADRPIPYDLFSELPHTGRIVLIDGEDVAGGGIICPN